MVVAGQGRVELSVSDPGELSSLGRWLDTAADVTVQRTSGTTEDKTVTVTATNVDDVMPIIERALGG